MFTSLWVEVDIKQVSTFTQKPLEGKKKQKKKTPKTPPLPASPPSAVREVLPALHEAAPPEPEGAPPPAARRPHAVRPLPQGHRPLAGAGPAVLAVRVHTGEDGRGQGNQSYRRAETAVKKRTHAQVVKCVITVQ